MKPLKRFDLVIMAVAVAVVAGGLGFAAGRATAPKTLASAQPNSSGSTNGRSGAGFGQGGGGSFARRGSRPTVGTVASLNGQTLTITDQSGATKTITLTSSTTYTSGRTTPASQSDLATGDSVAVIGSAGTNGTITATRVIINPSFGGAANSPASSSAAQ